MSKFVACLTLFAAALLALPAAAQTCPNGSDVHYQNDVLPQVPTQFTAVAVIPGLCEGEGCASVFDLSGPGPQTLTQVAAPFTSQFGSVGAVATINVVVFDNVTFNGAGVPNMSNKVFDLNQDTGNSIQVVDGGLNVIDMTPYNVTVTGPKFAVGFVMNINPNGNCTSGFPSNFFTDNTACAAGKSLIRIQGQGWVDTALAAIGPFTLCGFGAYNGQWVIRACTEPVGNPLNVTVIGSPAIPGQFVQLIFNAPGHAGHLYVAGASGSINSGIAIPPHGTFPLDYDSLLNLSIFSGGGGIFNNFIGTVGPAGTAPGLILLPSNAPPGIDFYVAFVTFDPFDGVTPWGISSPALVQIQ
ncbi:hypothetical protein Pla163_33260 [Planctomycetes bacterium Pla163]|jgi:hypothetical protein|uniref:IPT/TIG domain protein n=1 Tax=Rohdeia mirabilis TaxID=2528008 RepID=A0A518D3X6_9BACT|nr:hypothetical protein Pla163_33260 [Planctomycetes bacterium Pla163]